MIGYCKECEKNELRAVKIQDQMLGNVEINYICKYCWEQLMKNAFNGLTDVDKIDDAPFNTGI
jgi:predicted SprT family Zn-dependent metalloprotease